MKNKAVKQRGSLKAKIVDVMARCVSDDGRIWFYDCAFRDAENGHREPFILNILKGLNPDPNHPNTPEVMFAKEHNLFMEANPRVSPESDEVKVNEKNYPWRGFCQSWDSDDASPDMEQLMSFGKLVASVSYGIKQMAFLSSCMF